MKKRKILLKIFVFMCFFICLLFSLLYLFLKLSPKLDLKKANNVIIYDKDDNVIFKGNGDKEWISLKNIDKDLINATIATEDKRFYGHNGFDYVRIIKSFFNNVSSGGIVEGASTITQQYARNLYLTFDRTYKRKFKEAYLALRMEVNYSKDEILEGYLNTINYGNGVFGIENAAHYYFNKSASNLSLAESSMLAGIPKYPQEYSPINNIESAKKRQRQILDNMVSCNYITKKDADEAYNEELVYYGKKETLDMTTLMYYKDAVMDELYDLDILPKDYLESNSIKIYTNLDIKAQEQLENAVKNNIEEGTDIQVASVLIENSSGKIIALTGGKDYEKSQFNRVTSSKRQVGSTIKPFLYYAALENGFTPSSLFLSTNTSFNIGNELYNPSNFADIYPDRKIPMILALAYSDNIYALKTNMFLGDNVFVDTLKKVGINSIENNVSLPLGTSEISIKDLTTGYSVLANEGKKNDSYLIRTVKDNNDNELYNHQDNEKQVLDNNLTFIMSNLLNNCYDATLIDYNEPTCLSLRPKLTKTYAVKTGSSDTDSLIVGYNKKYTMGVWVGYDDNRKLISGDTKYSRNIWADTLENYLRNEEDSWYEKPQNVTAVLVNPLNGKIATNASKRKKFIYYLKGTEPKEIDNEKDTD
ncbi:MAG: PBP1A family penicillin-binding protein [Bacilli bacterium]|nr:PBP1A family penicillin-binding protein [Bacilli bacterium]